MKTNKSQLQFSLFTTIHIAHRRGGWLDTALLYSTTEYCVLLNSVLGSRYSEWIYSALGHLILKV